MKIKIDLEALLYNSWGECENGWCAEADSVSGAVAKLKDVSLSGSPDCEMSTSFEMYCDDALIYKGDWTRLRELAAIEEEVRKNFKYGIGLEEYFYKKRTWLLYQVESTPVNSRRSEAGLFKGSKYEVVEYCKQFEEDNSWYEFSAVDFVN